ncbi:hypothetical protein ACIRVF_25885 [Kitasatospora sp. NPDC101157]|uniref:hypothetical protein n=1 Tax=Kitasatospora sp. NPDC101157 TaxID=3364098 RepID=UPI00382C6EBB
MSDPLVREVFPDLVRELTALLEAEGEPELAADARELRLVADCSCGDDFCRSFRTAPHRAGRPYGPGHRCVPLLPAEGTLILDVVDGRIVYVEVLGRESLRDLREPPEQDGHRPEPPEQDGHRPEPPEQGGHRPEPPEQGGHRPEPPEQGGHRPDRPGR